MNEDGEIIQVLPEKPDHYHGDTVRVLFVTAAILVFAMKFVGTAFAFGPMMLLILTLVIAAGLTNPVQKWIHSANMLISVAGVLTFGWLAFSRINSVEQLLSAQGLSALIALIFLAALYLSTRTVRGFAVPHVEKEV